MFCCICPALTKLLFQHTRPSSKIGSNTYYTLTIDKMGDVQSEEVTNAEDYLLDQPGELHIHVYIYTHYNLFILAVLVYWGLLIMMMVKRQLYIGKLVGNKYQPLNTARERISTSVF